MKFWSVEDTGWSGGKSWFKTGGSDASPLRFDSYDAAYQYASKTKREFNQQTTLWRVVETTIERADNSEVITRKWTMV